MQLQLNATGDAVTGQQEFLAGSFGRLRTLCVSPAGRVYVATSRNDSPNQILTLENRGFVLSNKSKADNAALGLWPNPARQTATLRLPAPPASPTAATIHDALGRVVRTAHFAPRQADLDLNLAGLRARVYVVQVRTETAQYARRLVVE